MQFRRNASLIAGILIPVAMLLFVVATALLPGMLMHPQYNFLYVTGDDYFRPKQGRLRAIQRHNIEKGKLALSEPAADVAQDYNPPRNAKLYVHDVANNRSREVSEEEAQRLSLDTRRLSPDGYAVVQNHSSGLIGLLMPVQDRNSRYLAGAWLSKKLNLEMPSANIQVRVLGWIQH